MKVALITTTINIPTVLALYRKLGPDVAFFVTGDHKTPDEEVVKLLDGGSNNNYYTINQQHELGYKCSELLGENNDSRRNIALLEAVKYGAEIIISVDDDMTALGQDFFERFEIMLSEPYSGLQFSSPDKWCDVGQYTIPPASQRGLPAGYFETRPFSFVTDVQIGAMQGIILGVPDANASVIEMYKPIVHSATDILRNGFVVNPQTKAVFNSQITGFRRELAPCFAQFYRWQGRNTDIMASLIMRRIMRERELHTYFGPPFGYHARSERDPRKDYEAEKWGRENVVRFADCLDATILPPVTVVQQTQYLYNALDAAGHIPEGMLETVSAFLEDMGDVL